jgi:hypothetical protein
MIPKRMCCLGLAGAVLFWLAQGCARLPYTTAVVHETERLLITLQREVEPAGYSHPAHVDESDIASVLRGFSIRREQKLPLPWYAEEEPPKNLFRQDEIAVLAPALSEALRRAGTDERVRFEVRAPGLNPAVSRDVTAGWLAIRDPFLYLTIEHLHAQIPKRKFDQYDYNYPTPPPLPGSFLLYFEPGRFWTADPTGRRGLDYRAFLKSAIEPQGAPAR